MIDLRNLTVRYGEHKVLDAVSLQSLGGAMGLLGPNGAGKSTLLKALLGFILPDEGEGTILGLDMRSQKIGILRKTGYMPENDCHIPDMNAVSFVSYAGQLAGMKPKDAMQRAHEALFYVGLGEARYRSLETYSTGMKQRIKLAQALVHDPELVLLDEPTNGLDPRGRVEMLDLIRDVSTSKGIHVIFSSHLLPDVEWVCREVTVIHEGRILGCGNIEEIRRDGKPLFECRVKGSAREFGEKLGIQGFRWEEDGKGGLRIHLEDGLTPQELLRVARDHRVQIRRLVPIRQSLEEVFLKMTQGE